VPSTTSTWGLADEEGMTEDLESAGVGLASGAADGANRGVDLDGDEPQYRRAPAAGCRRVI
jgi:hypothetical protein